MSRKYLYGVLQTTPIPDRMRELKDYVKEQAALADKSSHEWDKGNAKEQAAYRAGMWYAYRDVLNKIE